MPGETAPDRPDPSLADIGAERSVASGVVADDVGRRLCETACRVAADVIHGWPRDPRVWQKAPGDVVTEVDLACQRAIRGYLAAEAPGADFVAEEEGASDLSPMAGPWCFVVDPIDGTANFARGIPFYAVSVAMMVDGEIAAGAVLDVARNEMFSAHRGGGATADGVALAVHPCDVLAEALVGLSFPAVMDRDDPVVQSVANLLPLCPQLRRFGSAALTLASLAAGRLDGYFSAHVKPWDVAAGVLIATEAGAFVTNLDDGPFDPVTADFVAGSTDALRAEIGGHVREHRIAVSNREPTDPDGGASGDPGSSPSSRTPDADSAARRSMRW